MKGLFKQVDITSIVFMRIVYGLLAFGELMGMYVYYHLTKDTFNPAAFHFTYYGLEWVKPLPEPFISMVFILGLIAALCVALGKFYRVACIVTGLILMYAFCMEETLYLNHGYLMTCLAFILAFFPMNRSFSLDVLKRPERCLTRVPVYYQFILAFLMGVVYFYGGIAKMNPDWIRAQPLLIWMEYKKNLFLIGPIIQKDIVAWVMSIGGLAFDLSAAFLLMFKRTRKLGMGLAISFHLINVLIFNIGAFPWLSLALSLMFFPSTLLPNFFHWLDRKVPIWARQRARYRNYFGTDQREMPISPRLNRQMRVCLILLVGFNLLMPLRHHLYTGNVNWTEEGHKFSWRMMLRNKSGVGSFVIKDESGEIIDTEDGREYLTKRQRFKMLGQPDMILQFAQFLGDKYEAEGHGQVSVHADIKVRLNGNSFQRFIDKEVDLRAVKWHPFQSQEWILPFEYDY